MSKIEVDKIDPQSGTDLELGTSGDTITIPAGVTFDSSAATNTLPSTVVTTDGTQTLTNKSIAATQLTGTITPSDSTVSTAKLIDNSVTSQKLGYAEATLTDGATVTWNAETQDVCKLTLGGNRTLAAPTNGTTGQFISILVIQDSTGGRTITWNAVYEFAADTAPTLTATANLGDLFTFRYNGTKWLEVGRNLALTLS